MVKIFLTMIHHLISARFSRRLRDDVTVEWTRSSWKKTVASWLFEDEHALLSCNYDLDEESPKEMETLRDSIYVIGSTYLPADKENRRRASSPFRSDPIHSSRSRISHTYVTRILCTCTMEQWRSSMRSEMSARGGNNLNLQACIVWHESTPRLIVLSNYVHTHACTRKIHGRFHMCTHMIFTVIAYQFKLKQPKSREEQKAVIVKKILHFIGFISHFPNLN